MSRQRAIPRLRDWMIHRASVVRLAWPAGLAEAAGVSAAALDSIAAAGSLSRVGRANRAYIARALKVSVRELEALAAGRIDWIADEKIVDFNKLSPTNSRPIEHEFPQAILCSPGTGAPILGRISDGGKVEHFTDWTVEEGPRLAIRYPELPDAFGLELAIDFQLYRAGDCLAFQPVPPGEIKVNEIVLLTHDLPEDETRLWRVASSSEGASFIICDLCGQRREKTLHLPDVLRAGRLIGFTGKKWDVQTASRC